MTNSSFAERAAQWSEAEERLGLQPERRTSLRAGVDAETEVNVTRVSDGDTVTPLPARVRP